ncbi:ABC transporter permease [Craterilacuibacter sp. RT1T]|uniref:ABC transporter permease n=1 Tax=Craterilacuibacter sp. RT1T TaxID=2942211 RepID=UPI0020C078D6|nr:ABC transporter permease [Craterilacuibacter sp. RT1T]MCL6263676.1 ABC transporter permease [Craterilacuibacter sp. RT1T]
MKDLNISTEWSYSARPDNLLYAAKNALVNFWKARFLFSLMVKNRVTDRYHGSVIGVAWSLLNPLLTMLGLVLIFPLIARFSIPNYTVYLLSGIVCWSFISNSLAMGGECFIHSRGLVKSIHMPSLLIPFVFVSAELVGLFFSVAAVLLLCAVFGLVMHINIFLLGLSVLLVYVFGLGMALIMSIVVTYFRDVQHIVGVALQSLFYLSAIIYPVSALPEQYQFMMYFNVFHHFINLFQISIYGGGVSTVDFLLPIVSSFSIFLLGVICNVKFSKSIVFRV